MAKKEIIYRGQTMSKSDLINTLMQLQRLGQTQGREIDWETIVDDLVDNRPHHWLDEEMTELDDIIRGDD